jgi:acetyltransferase AlgX (SGNH hydrolase-like protein)
MAYLSRRNLILVAITAIILFYFSAVALWIYLLSLLAVTGLCHRFSSTSAARVANFIANTATLTFSALILVLLLEIGLHLHPHFFIGDRGPDILGEFSDFTSRGYLTEEVFQKPKDGFRILGLGDSFAVCLWDQKKNYHNVLQDRFTALGGSKVEIVNAGMESIGPGYFWHILKKFGDRFKPDLVLVGFFMDDMRRSRFDISLSSFISEPKNLAEKLWGYRQFRESRLHQLIKKKYFWYRDRLRKAQEAGKTGETDVGGFSNETFLEIEKDRICLLDKNKRGEFEGEWRQCSRVISQMKQWCDQRNIEMVLAIFPDQFQVEENLREEIYKKYNLAADSLDLEYPNYRLSNYCKENKIHCLDLLGPFREQGQSGGLYALRDTHWNEAGNRLAAEVIFQYLRDRQLIQ